jgi:hypothetical protein
VKDKVAMVKERFKVTKSPPPMLCFW